MRKGKAEDLFRLFGVVTKNEPVDMVLLGSASCVPSVCRAPMDGSNPNPEYFVYGDSSGHNPHESNGPPFFDYWNHSQMVNPQFVLFVLCVLFFALWQESGGSCFAWQCQPNILFDWTVFWDSLFCRDSAMRKC